MRFYSSLVASLFVGLSFSAVACTGTVSESEEPVEGDVGSVSAADSIATTSTFYSVRRDVRRCAFPMCGGFFVKRVNTASTICHDGVARAECYVVNMDLENTLGLDAAESAKLRGEVESGHVVLRGKVRAATYGHRTLGFFFPSEAWQAQALRTPTGVFYKATDRGIRCFTSPCFSVHEAKLNTTTRANVAGLDLAASGLNEEQVAQALTAFSSPTGVIVAGTHATVTGPAGCGTKLVASEVYLKVTHTEQAACVRTGCSGVVCADHSVITTCIYRPEYACYRDPAVSTECTRLENGQCGWTNADALSACIEQARTPSN